MPPPKSLAVYTQQARTTPRNPRKAVRTMLRPKPAKTARISALATPQAAKGKPQRPPAAPAKRKGKRVPSGGRRKAPAADDGAPVASDPPAEDAGDPDADPKSTPVVKAKRKAKSGASAAAAAAAATQAQVQTMRKQHQQYLAQLAERKKQELKDREREDEKKARLVAKARAAVLSNCHRVLSERGYQVPAAPAQEKPERKRILLRDVPSVASKVTQSQQNRQMETHQNSGPIYTDFAQWKRRRGLDEGTLVFNITGPYQTVRQCLLDRGWVENPDPESPCYDFKFALKGQELQYKSLRKDQIVNHFPKNGEVCTKVGLCRNLKNLVWFDSVHIDTFFPRCFDLGNPDEHADFVDEFRFLAAERVLKRHARDAAETTAAPPTHPHAIALALRVAHLRLNHVEREHQDIDQGSGPPVSALEYDFLVQYSYDPAQGLAFLERIADSSRKAAHLLEKVRATGDADAALDDQVSMVLASLAESCPQFHMSGANNIWIVKPAGKSRGRGIELFDNLDRLFEYVGREGHWVVQKYIENPLLIHNRKFDIRQWVMVTSWNPLTVYFYQDCYLRFASSDYDMSDIADRYIHLCNNSVQKHSDQFDNNPDMVGNMWSSDTAASALGAKFGRPDLWESEIVPRMKQIILWALMSTQDVVVNRPNTFELFGVDLMIDEQLNMWLVEVNSSPTLEHCTPVTTHLCTNVVQDIIKAVVDQNQLSRHQHKGRVGDQVGAIATEIQVENTRWQLIHRADTVRAPMVSVGSSLMCSGTSLKIKRGGGARNRPEAPRQFVATSDGLDAAGVEAVAMPVVRRGSSASSSSPPTTPTPADEPPADDTNDEDTALLDMSASSEGSNTSRVSR